MTDAEPTGRYLRPRADVPILPRPPSVGTGVSLAVKLPRGMSFAQGQNAASKEPATVTAPGKTSW
jgi:hypothetical protein